MKGSKAFIQAEVDKMKIGQRLVIPRHVFEDAFNDVGWPSIYNTSIESFLSKQIGSAWGCIRCECDLMTGDYIISKHEESEKRYYTDPDREYLYDRQHDGTLKLKEYYLNKDYTLEQKKAAR
jgi:hypothetical protein